MSRQRTTWRTAGAPPAVPMDLQGHPNAQPDPGPDAYKNGDPSSWAEDPHKGPYNEVPAPSMPREAALARQATLRKSAKCVKLAEYMLGPKATDQQIESQALAMMEWDDGALDQSLENLGQSVDPVDAPIDLDDGADFDALDFDALDLDDDQAIEPLEWDAAPYNDGQFDALDLDDSNTLSFDEFDDFDPEAALAEMEDEDSEALLASMLKEEADKESAGHMAALEQRIAGLEQSIAGLGQNLSRVASIMVKMAGEDAEPEDKPKDESEDESEDEPKDEPKDESEDDASDKTASLDIQFDAPVDPMVMLAGDNSLQALYGKTAAEEAEEEAQKQAARVANQRAVKASQAPKPVKTLGNVRVASQVNSLESLWHSDPDLSGHF